MKVFNESFGSLVLIECYQSRNQVDIQAVVMMDFALERLLVPSRN